MKFLKRISAVAISMIMMCSIAEMNVFAASTKQDGLEVSIMTDKENYIENEKITATLSVKNTNTTDVTDVTMETVVPDGYKIDDGLSNIKKLETLAPNKTEELKVVYVSASNSDSTVENSHNDSEKQDSANNEVNQNSNKDEISKNSTVIQESTANYESKAENTNTGDTKKVMVIVSLIVISVAIGILCLRNKKGKGILSIVLCISAVGSIVAIAPFKTNAAESIKIISIEEQISVNGKKLNIQANINYKIEVNDEHKESEEPLEQELKDGKFIDNNESFSISDSQIANFDDISKSILERVTYKLENVKYGTEKGTADIIVYSPDLKSAFDKAIAESEKTMNIDDEYIIEKTSKLLIEYINNAELKEYKLSVDLDNKNGKWIVVVDSALADALTGNIEEVYYSTYDERKEE